MNHGNSRAHATSVRIWRRGLLVGCIAAALAAAEEAPPPPPATTEPPAAPAPATPPEEMPEPATTAEVLARIGDLEDARVTDIAPLIEFLGHDQPAVRARAAVALGRIQDPLAMEALGRAARDTDLAVASAAVFALGQLFNRAAALLVLEALTSEAPELRAAAVTALGKAGDRNVTAALVARLADDDGDVRGAAALAIARLGDQNATLELVRRMASETDPQVRWRLAYALARLDDSRARPALLVALEDRSMPLARLWAVQGLRTQLDDDEVARRMLARRDDPDARVVIALLQATARMPRAFLLADLVRLAQHPSAHVRAELATAAAAIGGRDAAALLETLRRDESLTVRSASVAALAVMLDRHALPVLDEESRNPAWQVRVAVAGGLAALATDEANSRLIALLEDPDTRVQSAVANGIGERLKRAPASPARAELIATLVAALQIEDIAVRGQAAEALVAIADPTTVPALVAALEAWGDRDLYELRETLVRGLGEIGGEGVLPVLEACLEDEFVAVRAAAAEAITALTGQPRSYARISAPSDDPKAPPPPPLEPPGAKPAVIIATTRGQIVLDLHADEAPRHVARFLQSVERKLYDGLEFHRVVPNFVIQGGDPLGHGWGDAGFSLRDEINPLLYLSGTVGMPKAGKDTGGCQLFITHAPQPSLDGRYTVFATVRSGMEVVDAIEIGDKILSVLRIDTAPREPR